MQSTDWAVVDLEGLGWLLNTPFEGKLFRFYGEFLEKLGKK